MAESFDLSALIDEFREEAGGQLDLLDAALLELERSGQLDDAESEPLLRALHTLKGNAGMVGLAPIRDQVHRLESVFREDTTWTQASVDRLFEVASRLRRAIQAAGRADQDDAFAALSEVPVEPEVGGGAAAGRRNRQRTSGSAPSSEPRPRDTATERIRVPFRRLDELLNQVGRVLGVTQSLHLWLREHRQELREAGLWRDLETHAERLLGLSHELRHGVMQVRLVPAAAAVSRFPRVARDLARDQGKRLEVELRGETTELDKSTVDALAEPLLHLVRNAVDHGIETPAEREKAGKDPVGLLVIGARQAGERVVITVEDDGRGLDRQRIRRRARVAGVDAGDVDPEELIFRSGFSTRERESTVSGRGVGLDVVRRQVQELRGEVRVEEREGGGTRFVLDLPLTVAITSAVLFETDGEILALPAADVEETVRASGGHAAGRTAVLRHRGETIPLARPARLFGWRDAAGPEAAEFALVVRRGGRALALAADRLIDQRDVMVKRLPAFLGRRRGVSGVSVTSGGRAVLLIDPEALLELSVESQANDG